MNDKAYKLLSYEERTQIEQLYNSDVAVSEIAMRLHRDADVIYRELRKGRVEDRTPLMRKKYSAELGQKTYQDNVARRGRRRNS